MLLADLVAASTELRTTPSRTAKIARLAAACRDLAPNDLRLAVSWLSGVLPQGRIGLGWAAVAAATEVPPTDVATLTLDEADRSLAAIADESGTGSVARRTELLAQLLGAATAPEQEFLRGLLLGELRQGAKEGLVLEAVATATGVTATALRRALMLLGDLGDAAGVAAADGMDGLRAVQLALGRPVRPMLASSAATVAEAFASLDRATIEVKLDGMRIQVHRRGDRIDVVTRSLRNVTDDVPGVVAAVRTLDVDEVILDGEALAMREDGRPAPFQQSMSSGGEGGPDGGMQPFFFDILHVDGRDLLDAPLAQRLAELDAVVPAALRVRRLDEPSLPDAEAFATSMVAEGQEGVVVKSLEAPYLAGRRGKAWIKVKPVHTLDLVILAVEWGSGRRQGWLSNLHLGARDGDNFVMLGKTFKGLTDDMLRWQTERLLAIEVSRTRHVVRVQPQLVVEVAFDGVQDSSRYPGGVTLRFARVRRHRPDKRAEEADTLADIVAIRDRQRG